eukprot:12219941-Karenia_brevis.AAC.1
MEAKIPQLFTRCKRLSDLQPVGKATAESTVALLAKQLHAIGCPTWETHEIRDAEAPGVHVFCYTSDRGPDQAAGRIILDATFLPFERA